MCLAPQRRALFQHLNFQKWSETDVFWHFLLPKVLRATTACNFSCLICPDASAPAALASLLFDPPEPQNTGKTPWPSIVKKFLHFLNFWTICTIWTLLDKTELFWEELNFLFASSIHRCRSGQSFPQVRCSQHCYTMSEIILNWTWYIPKFFSKRRKVCVKGWQDLPKWEIRPM